MPRRMAVAVSGGRDSTALLHASVRVAGALDLEVLALHVNHGLMASADQWEQHVAQQCARWRRNGWPVAFHARRLSGTPGRGESVEAWARRERYRALSEMAREQGVSIVLLAHHRLDQAETFLLQALRGAGPPGLSAMPRTADRLGIRWERPWLDHPRRAIETYVRRHRLSYVNDTSNEDIRFARNRIRHSIWPAVREAFPHAEGVLVASSRRMQEAQRCLEELAALDRLDCVSRDGFSLNIQPWALLSPARRANLLRFWLGGFLTAGVPESLVRRLVGELPSAQGGARWPAPEGKLQVQRRSLCWTPTDLERTGH